MRDLPVALSAGSSLDDLKKHTFSLTHTHIKEQRQRQEEKLILSVHWFYLLKEVRVYQRVLIGISSSHPTLMFFVPLPAVSGLIFSHEAGSEIWLYLSVPLLPDRQPDNRSAHYHLICTCTHLIKALCAALGLESRFTIYSTADQLSHWAGCITVT